ncbi:unnamed protein product [Acanthosepion pharaonis]|uniref:Uncharacterized protein n=1 Tax=Acanthosepion pharaonis TaxID=158019 RepID=A0A812CHK0_ACAPH|nr:unnamed protein product [Sepia pharaonis]
MQSLSFRDFFSFLSLTLSFSLPCFLLCSLGLSLSFFLTLSSLLNICSLSFSLFLRHSLFLPCFLLCSLSLILPVTLSLSSLLSSLLSLSHSSCDILFFLVTSLSSLFSFFLLCSPAFFSALSHSSCDTLSFFLAFFSALSLSLSSSDTLSFFLA